ncbi:MAG: glycoside hydrolase family 15 protein [Geminicoccaceae bacterium]
MSRPIEDYALIGDTRSAALVGKDGSIDWLCVPRFDSPACFAALLGDRDNGRWQIAPIDAAATVRRSYRDETLILETEFTTATGVVTVVDFMPRPDNDGQVDVVRLVQGRRGSVDMQTEFVLRFDYGSVVPWVQRRVYGLRAVAGPDAVRFEAPIELESEDFRTTGRFTVREGETHPFRLTWFPSDRRGPVVGEWQEDLADCAAWWHDWAMRCTYRGPYRDAVLRSLIVLKALTYGPTGGIVAAVTTSLPERLGGARNWDYRYCWLRDSTLTLDALASSGFLAEARAWRDWLLRAVAGKPSQLQIMYSVTGERRLQEAELPWLAGYAESRPVRIGNAAHGQVQLDVYGEIMDSFHVDRVHGLPAQDEAWQLQRVLLESLETAWKRPDEGIWEVRGPPRHFTHSKVMAWVAFDRAVKAVEAFGLDGPVERWRRVRDAIHDDVCTNGFDAELNSFVQHYGATQVDAALLMIPLVGFLAADDPRMVGTVDRIMQELTVNGLLRRYVPAESVDGLAGDEGVFLACSFWLADVLCLMGRLDEARTLFHRLLALRNDVGLLAEEYEWRTGRQLGNFPQAFSHIGLIATAHNLGPEHGPAHRRAGRHAHGRPRPPEAS